MGILSTQIVTGESFPPLHIMNDEEVRDWFFTFGYGQYDGLHRYHFVRISGTFSSARAEMVRRYGQVWANQYASEEDAGVLEFGLKEIK